MPHGANTQFMEADCDNNPTTQEQMEAGIAEAKELGIPLDNLAPTPSAPNLSAKARRAAKIREANSRVPRAMPQEQHLRNLPTPPQTPEAARGHIPVNKPLRPLFSTVTAKVVSQQQGQAPFLSATK